MATQLNKRLQKEMDKASVEEVAISIIHSFQNEEIVDIATKIADYLVEYCHYDKDVVIKK